MIGWILAGVIGVVIGGVIVVFTKLQFSANWSNKEFDGTMFIGAMLLAYIGTLLGTYLKESFAGLETTKEAFDTFENIFMIIVGYLFKKAVDIAKDGIDSGNQKG